MNHKIYGLISLGTKAGKIASGTFAADKAIKSGKAKLVIVSGDAAANTKKAFADACRYYRVRYVEFGLKDDLGKYTGKEERVVLAVLESGFAQSILNLIEID